MRMHSMCGAAAGTLALVMMAFAQHPASAAKLKTLLRAVLVPEEAQHYEDLARQHRRPEEQRYWREYRDGLEEQRRERGIGPDEARRYEEMAHRDRHPQQERYWQDYRSGFEGPGPRR